MTNRLYRRSLAGALLFAGYCLLIGGPLTPSALPQNQPRETTLTGTVGDDKCGNAHMVGTAKKCTMDCIKHQSADYALVVGQRVLTLQGKVAGLEKLAGEKAKVTGFVRGEDMMVTAVASAQ